MQAQSSDSSVAHNPPTMQAQTSVASGAHNPLTVQAQSSDYSLASGTQSREGDGIPLEFSDSECNVVLIMIC